MIDCSVSLRLAGTGGSSVPTSLTGIGSSFSPSFRSGKSSLSVSLGLSAILLVRSGLGFGLGLGGSRRCLVCRPITRRERAFAFMGKLTYVLLILAAAIAFATNESLAKET